MTLKDGDNRPRIAKLEPLLSRLSGMTKDIPRLARVTDRIYSEPDGSPISYARYSSLVLGHLERPSSPDYGLDIFTVEGAFSSFSHVVRENMAQLNSGEDDIKSERLSSIISLADSICNTIEENAYDGGMRQKIASLQLPLTDEGVQTLDSLFAAPSEPNDAAFAVYTLSGLHRSDKDREESLQLMRELERKLGIFFSKRMDSHIDIFSAYFDLMLENVEQNYFNGTSLDALADKPLLGIILAAIKARSMSVLPDTFKQFLEGGMFGELDRATQSELMKYYNHRFAEEHGDILNKEDDTALASYGVAHETGLEERKDIAQRLIPQEPVDTLKATEVYGNIALIKKGLSGWIDTVGDINNISFKIASYDDGLLDLIFITEDEQSGLVLQVNKEGRIYGMPEGISDEDARQLVDAALIKIPQHMLEHRNVDLNWKSKRTKSSDSSRRGTAVSDNTQSQTKEESRPDFIRVPQPQNPRGTRRKGRTAQDQDAANSRVESKEYSPYPKHDITTTEAFDEELSLLSDEIKVRVQQKIKSVAEGNSPTRKLRSSKEAGTNLYRARVGDYRVVFVDRGENRWDVIKVYNRKDVYDELKRQIDSLLQNLQ